jgi:hypothetical protein
MRQRAAETRRLFVCSQTAYRLAQIELEIESILRVFPELRKKGKGPITPLTAKERATETEMTDSPAGH